MAMGNPAQWSFHVLRAHPGLGSAHLSCRATWMLLDRAPSWRQRRWPQPVNEAQDLSEQRSWDGDLRQLESDIAAVAHDLGADLDQLLAQGGQRPMFHRLGQGQRPEEVADIVGQGMQLKTYLVVAEAMAGKPGPVDRVLALLDVLLRRAADCRRPPPVRQAG